MDLFFNPQSVVVVGASNAMFSLGGSICNLLKNYIPYKGRVYAVNSRGEPVYDCPGYPSVSALPETPDLAVIIVGAANVAGVLRDCAAKGIKRVVVESSGFSECGEAGVAMQAEIDEIAASSGMRLIGPNCLGVLSTGGPFSCFYGVNPSLVEMIKVVNSPGKASYVCQSGGVAVLLVESAFDDLVGVNKVVAIGNRCDLDEADFIDYFQTDDTEVIGLYVENVGHGRRLMDAARRSGKPILVYKAGRTEEGSRAALSHTAGMAGNDRIFDAACRQAGLIRVEGIDELRSMPKIFTEMPPLAGRRIATFTNSGAFGSIGSDLLVQAGFDVVRLSPETRARLEKTGQIFNAGNPVDIGPALPQTYLDIFQILLSAPEVDGMLALLTGWQPFVIDCLQELHKMCRHFGKPAAIYTPNTLSRILATRAGRRLPLFESAEQAVRALAISHTHHQFTNQPVAVLSPASAPAAGALLSGNAAEMIAAAKAAGRRTLNEFESRQVIAGCVSVPRETMVNSRDEAIAQAAAIGYPVVLKGAAHDLAHKTEMDMVRVNLKDAADVGAAYDHLTGRGIRLDGVLVQEMVKGAREFVIGMSRDPHFGPCVMFGLGGTLTEALNDVAFRVAPLTVEDARSMIGEIRTKKLLGSFRGDRPVDVDALVGALVGIGRLAVENDDIAEIDINPLIVRAGTPVAVDAVVVLKS